MIQAVYAGLLGLLCTVGLIASEKGEGEIPLSTPSSSVPSSPKKGFIFERRGLSLSLLPIVEVPDEFVAMPSAERSAEGGSDVHIRTPTSMLCSKLTFSFSEEGPVFSQKRFCTELLFPPISSIALPADIAIEGVEFYVGPRAEAENSGLLREKGITHVISITAEREKPMKFAEGLSILPLQFPDNGEASLEEPIDMAYEFIEAARQMGQSKVFIHCHAGQSRSVTILLSYLIRKQCEKPREEGVVPGSSDLISLLKVVKKSRPSANPNLHFLGALQELEDKWRQEADH